MRAIKRIIIHCSATGPHQDISVSDIDRWHRQRGFTKVGYHKVIRRSGAIESGRPYEEVGAHVAGHNADSIGICLAGGVGPDGKAQDNFTKEQWASLEVLLQALKKQFPQAAVLGHRDVPGVAKDCPSFDVKTWLVKHGF